MRPAGQVTGVAESMGCVPAFGAATSDAASVLGTPTINSFASGAVFLPMTTNAESFKICWIIVTAILVLVMNFEPTPTYAAATLTGRLPMYLIVAKSGSALPIRVVGPCNGPSAGEVDAETFSGTGFPSPSSKTICGEIGAADNTTQANHNDTVDGLYFVVNRSNLLGGHNFYDR